MTVGGGYAPYEPTPEEYRVLTAEMDALRGDPHQADKTRVVSYTFMYRAVERAEGTEEAGKLIGRMCEELSAPQLTTMLIEAISKLAKESDCG